MNDSLDVLSAPRVLVGTPVDIQESIYPADSWTAVKQNGGEDKDENEGISNCNCNEVEAKDNVEGHEGKSKQLGDQVPKCEIATRFQTRWQDDAVPLL